MTAAVPDTHARLARNADLLRLALTGAPRDRLEAVSALATSLEQRLGPPDLERLEW